MTQRQRKPTRLNAFDYAQPGAYFVTICTHNRACIFGEVVDGVMRLNAWGQIAAAAWAETTAHRPQAQIDASVVMPNHTHAIIVIEDAAHRGLARQGLARQTPTFGHPIAGALGTIVGAYKSSVTRAINRLRDDQSPVWQRNYHDHIIRDAADLNRIRAYVAANPARWTDDTFYS